jgi:hypothetical protein
MTNEPIGYWIYKSDDIQNYQIRSKSLFSHILSAIHPIFNVFSKFDISISRLSRFYPFFLQISAFALICVAVFGPYYRENDTHRLEDGLEMKDINIILLVGILGSFALLPIFSCTNCIRSKMDKTSPVKI